MKIRSDFVTNSSSSSFVVEVEVESAGSRIVFETHPTDEGANSNFKCTGEDVAQSASVKALCELLQKSMTGTGKTKIKGFVKDIEDNISDISEITSVTLRRIWISYGESSGCTVANDATLHELAKKITGTKGDQKEAACKELEEYLENAEVYTEGGWQDAWPTSFCGSTAKPKYKWDHMGLSAPDLAKKIAGKKIDNNDLAVETIVVDMKNKTVSETADFILDGNEKGIGKKPAKKSNSFIRKLLEILCIDSDIKEGVPVTDIIPDCDQECDALDYVVYQKEQVVLAVSVKTAENARSKTFKNIETICKNASLNYLVLDEKKDNTESKLISKINTAFYYERFKKYVIDEDLSGTSEEETPNIGTSHPVQVRFADNRAYMYDCFSEVSVGDIVFVGGSKTGLPGMVVLISDQEIIRNEPPVGTYSVEKIIRTE